MIAHRLAAALVLAACLGAPAARAVPTPALPLLIWGNESAAYAEGARSVFYNPAGLGLRYPADFLASWTQPVNGPDVYRAALGIGGFGVQAEPMVGRHLVRMRVHQPLVGQAPAQPVAASGRGEAVALRDPLHALAVHADAAQRQRPAVHRAAAFDLRPREERLGRIAHAQRRGIHERGARPFGVGRALVAQDLERQVWSRRRDRTGRAHARRQGRGHEQTDVHGRDLRAAPRSRHCEDVTPARGQ